MIYWIHCRRVLVHDDKTIRSLRLPMDKSFDLRLSGKRGYVFKVRALEMAAVRGVGSLAQILKFLIESETHQSAVFAGRS